MATKDEVISVPEFQHLYQNFLKHLRTLPTIMLICRDNPWAMEVWEQVVTDREDFPIAMKTALGRALLGPWLPITTWNPAVAVWTLKAERELWETGLGNIVPSINPSGVRLAAAYVPYPSANSKSSESA